ncbi:TetR/AcrR family transcriptional regulator [Arenicella sp. 4NH20-0111]|uniref:TetR/AcrR family transcriptional regulator n=1 Tax=Arenicella sp. 4NH20-0111 TaxID=3127648 RepID=UPI003341EC7A
MKKAVKNKEDTMQRMVSSVGELIAEQGFANVGVNALARKAKVDKVLIYRYFDGLEGLYAAYANSIDFWPSVEEILGEEDDVQELMSQPFDKVLRTVLERFANAVRSRPLTIEIMAWEMVERNALTIALEQVREQMGLDLAAHMQKLDLPSADWPTITNTFIFAINYLAIRSRKIERFTGIEINSEQAWTRMFDSMEFLINGTGNSKS